MWGSVRECGVLGGEHARGGRVCKYSFRHLSLIGPVWNLSVRGKVHVVVGGLRLVDGFGR